MNTAPSSILAWTNFLPYQLVRQSKLLELGSAFYFIHLSKNVKKRKEMKKHSGSVLPTVSFHWANVPFLWRLKLRKHKWSKRLLFLTLSASAAWITIIGNMSVILQRILIRCTSCRNNTKKRGKMETFEPQTISWMANKLTSSIFPGTTCNQFLRIGPFKINILSIRCKKYLHIVKWLTYIIAQNWWHVACDLWHQAIPVPNVLSLPFNPKWDILFQAVSSLVT